MATPKTPKKRAADWHPADIVAALRKLGWSLTQLSLQHGYASKALSLATQKPYPKAEKIIADTLGVRPDQIWPSRYDGGVPNRRRGRPIRPAHVPLPGADGTSVRGAADTQTRQAA